MCRNTGIPQQLCSWPPTPFHPPHHHHSPPPPLGTSGAPVWESKAPAAHPLPGSLPRPASRAEMLTHSLGGGVAALTSPALPGGPGERRAGGCAGMEDGGLWEEHPAGAGSCRQDLEPQGQNAGLIQGIAEKEEGEKKGNQRSRGRRRPREKMRRKKKQKCLGPSGQEWAAHPFPGFTLLLLALPPAGASRQDVSLSLGAASQQNVSVL